MFFIIANIFIFCKICSRQFSLTKHGCIQAHFQLQLCAEMLLDPTPLMIASIGQPPSAKVDGLWANTPVLSIRTTICIDTDDLLKQPQLLEQ